VGGRAEKRNAKAQRRKGERKEKEKQGLDASSPYMESGKKKRKGAKTQRGEEREGEAGA
jgi:hypothetical protein